MGLQRAKALCQGVGQSPNVHIFLEVRITKMRSSGGGGFSLFLHVALAEFGAIEEPKPDRDDPG